MRATPKHKKNARSRRKAKPPRILMDKISERMKNICGDFLRIIRELKIELEADIKRHEAQSEAIAHRRQLIERLEQVDSHILDLATLAGWHPFIAEVDGVVYPDHAKPKTKPDTQE